MFLLPRLFRRFLWAHVFLSFISCASAEDSAQPVTTGACSSEDSTCSADHLAVEGSTHKCLIDVPDGARTTSFEEENTFLRNVSLPRDLDKVRERVRGVFWRLDAFDTGVHKYRWPKMGQGWKLKPGDLYWGFWEKLL